MHRVMDIDRYVGARMRERRIMLGLTLKQLAPLAGVTYQQAYKYENGINRVSAGRLYHIAQVLKVDIGYFFEGAGRDPAGTPIHRKRMPLELMRNFMAIPDRRHQGEVAALARALAQPDAKPLRSRRGRAPSSRI
jgi:transcriptional regulator with XRE-family HTH domain